MIATKNKKNKNLTLFVLTLGLLLLLHLLLLHFLLLLWYLTMQGREYDEGIVISV
jgi:hypothetical protein